MCRRTPEYGSAGRVCVKKRVRSEVKPRRPICCTKSPHGSCGATLGSHATKGSSNGVELTMQLRCEVQVPVPASSFQNDISFISTELDEKVGNPTS